MRRARPDPGKARELRDEIVDRGAEHLSYSADGGRIDRYPAPRRNRVDVLPVWGATRHFRIGNTRAMAHVSQVPPVDRTRILIADDDRFFAELLRDALASHDQFDVIGVFANGAEAVAGTKSLRPALVLMDVAMPLLDGIEATRQMQALDDPPTVVLITGEASERDDKRAYEAGASAYLRKTQELVSVIDVIVTLSRVGVAPL